MPEFDPVAFGINDPSELAIIVFFSLVVDFHAFSLELIQQSLKILDSEVDHERCSTRVEILRVMRKD